MTNKNKDLIVGAVVGSVLGAAAALLFAPKKGKELRADIAEGAHKLSDGTQRLAGDLAQKSKQLAGAVTEKTQAAAQTIGRQTAAIASKVKGQKKDDTVEAELQTAEASVAATRADQD